MRLGWVKETSPHMYPEAIHCTQEKGEGPKEGVAAPGPGLLIHILLPSIHILRGLHPKQPSERVGGTHSLANNSPRNRKRNRAGIEKTPLTRGVEKEGEEQAGTLLMAGEASLPGDNLHSRASTSLLFYTWRVEDTHTQNMATHPRNVGGEHTSIPWEFSKISVSPGGVATWKRRREGKETACRAQGPREA